MLKVKLIIIIILISFIDIYMQTVNVLPDPTAIDNNIGPQSSGFILAEGWPNFPGSDLENNNQGFVFSAFDNPEGFWLDPAENSVIQIDDKDAFLTDPTGAQVAEPSLSEGRQILQVESDNIGTKRISKKEFNGGTVIILTDLSNGSTRATREVNTANNFIDLPDNFSVGNNTPPGEEDIGCGNVDDLISIVREQNLPGPLNVTPIANFPGSEITIVDVAFPGPNPSPLKNVLSTTTTNNGGYIYFKADDEIYGQEVWISDGTLAGTHMVKDINPSGSSYPFGLTAMSGKLYFFASSASVNNGLWVTDGTEAGTLLIKDFNPGGGYNYVDNLININNTLYFLGSDGTNGAELWKSDGTTGGTFMIKNISSGSFSSSPYGFTLFKGLIYFSADDGVHGAELWVTDGTSGGTHLVKNINNTGDGSAGSGIILPALPRGDVFYFYADDGINGKEIWVSDGTREGTVLAYDLYPGPQSSNVYGGWGKIAGGNLYVSAEDGVIGYELFIFGNVPTTAPKTSLSLKIFLEGSYVSNSMSTNLTTSIPLKQPFNNTEGNYYGDESISSTFAAANNIVDWVVVELRSGATAATATKVVARKAVFVNNLGNLVDLDGTLDIDFKWVDAGDYYVSVYHRNHLAIMSSQVVTLANN